MVGDIFKIVDEKVYELLEKNSNSYLEITSDLPISFFDYESAIMEWNISYIIKTNHQISNKFLHDPNFHIVYKNKDVTIYKVQ